MKKYIFLLFLALVLAGCQKKDDTLEQRGVYYSKADEKEISSVYDENGCYVCSILSFDDKLYTSSYTIDYTDKSDIPYDSVLLDSLGTVSVNHGVYFAEDKSELSEVTGEGNVYTVKGYDKDFRVAVVFEQLFPSGDTYYYMIIFNNLNDITMEKGKELFEDRLNLSDAKKLEYCNGDENPIEISMDDVKELLASMNDASFINPKDSSFRNSKDKELYTISFYDEGGIKDSIVVYEDGYIMYLQAYDEADSIVLKLDSDKLPKCE